jgi:hypothetical protein
MHPSAKHVPPFADYVLFIEFDNDESGYLDMKPFLNFGVFNRIRDPEIFNQVRGGGVRGRGQVLQSST